MTIPECHTCSTVKGKSPQKYTAILLQTHTVYNETLSLAYIHPVSIRVKT